MPEAAHRECRAPRCAGYAAANGYCAEHQPDAKRSLRGPTYGTLNPSNKRFRRLRHSYLVRHPLCAACHTEAATVLDHVVPHRGMALLFWSQRNWQGLCVTCHGIKTAKELWSNG